MRVAVVGGGFAGLAVLWHVLESGGSATLFDQGEGASHASTGLLHPYPGKAATKAWRADEGMQAALALLDVAGSPYQKSGLLRLALTEEQKRDFRKTEEFWWGEEQVAKACPKAARAPGLYIPSAVTVYSRLYLDGLKRACRKKGAAFEINAADLHTLRREFDAVVLAAGAGVLDFAECKHLPLKVTKGQALLCRVEEPLPFALASQGHISAGEEKGTCLVGSTYERAFTDAKPDRAVASTLLQKVAAFYPPAKQFEILDVFSALRISPREGSRPIVEQVAPNVWVFTGLGSKGLLYHALLAKELACAILQNNL